MRVFFFFARASYSAKTLSQGPKADGDVVESQKPRSSSVVEHSCDRSCFLCVIKTRCAGGLGSHCQINQNKRVLEGGVVPTHFAASRTVFNPKSSTVDDNGLIVRSPDALRPLTLCDCDCKILTIAICFGLHRYSIRCIHLAQRCISSRQMTDNTFEVETTALAHVTCATCDSGILLTDVVAAYTSVNHTWILHVLDKAELPGFICRFLRSIYFIITTEVEFAGKTKRQFFMDRGVRQGCPANGFLFAMTVDPLSMAPRLDHPKKSRHS